MSNDISYGMAGVLGAVVAAIFVWTVWDCSKADTCQYEVLSWTDCDSGQLRVSGLPQQTFLLVVALLPSFLLSRTRSETFISWFSFFASWYHYVVCVINLAVLIPDDSLTLMCVHTCVRNYLHTWWLRLEKGLISLVALTTSRKGTGERVCRVVKSVLHGYGRLGSTEQL